MQPRSTRGWTLARHGRVLSAIRLESPQRYRDPSSSVGATPGDLMGEGQVRFEWDQDYGAILNDEIPFQLTRVLGKR
jgi:hypothetical protein